MAETWYADSIEQVRSAGMPRTTGIRLDYVGRELVPYIEANRKSLYGDDEAQYTFDLAMSNLIADNLWDALLGLRRYADLTGNEWRVALQLSYYWHWPFGRWNSQIMRYAVALDLADQRIDVPLELFVTMSANPVAGPDVTWALGWLHHGCPAVDTDVEALLELALQKETATMYPEDFAFAVDPRRFIPANVPPAAIDNALSNDTLSVTQRDQLLDVLVDPLVGRYREAYELATYLSRSSNDIRGAYGVVSSIMEASVRSGHWANAREIYEGNQDWLDSRIAAAAGIYTKAAAAYAGLEEYGLALDALANQLEYSRIYGDDTSPTVILSTSDMIIPMFQVAFVYDEFDMMRAAGYGDEIDAMMKRNVPRFEEEIASW